MLKAAFFRGQDERGIHAVPLFGPSDHVFEKKAAPSLLPEVARYIETLRPRNDAQYVLLNALGAGEYWGSNINGDFFPEAGLIHAPDKWKGVPIFDEVLARTWPYGFPTFYGAKPFLHHRNKDYEPHNHPSYGKVELAAWNDVMKRVELVARVDKKRCEEHNGMGVWDKLKLGQFPDVSMGCKVPFDTCSICLDWKEYLKALETFNPKKHKSPGEAALAYHRAKKEKDGVGVRGLAITRDDYCSHALKQMNHILPDGRKVFVRNDFPRFFDISFVFIGADKTAKVMLKIAAEGKAFWFTGSAELAEKLGYQEPANDATEKVAAARDPLTEAFLGKVGADKEGEIIKEVVPSQFAGKAVPLLTKNEEDLPRDAMNALSVSPLETGLSTLTGLGVVLRPREFQRIVLIQMGMGNRADEMQRDEQVFPRVKERTPLRMGPDLFSLTLARLLLPLLDSRSGLGPSVEKRVLVPAGKSEEKRASSSSLSSPLLRKIGAAYNGYRDGVMELVAHAPELIASTARPSESRLAKFASIPVEEVFTPLSAAYFKLAFWDEFGVCGPSSGSVETSQATANVERALPSRNTWTTPKNVAGGH